MDRPASATPGVAPVQLRSGRLARIFLGLCVVASLWLAVPPARDYFKAQDKAGATHRQLRSLEAQQRRLAAQSHDLSRGNGLEEQARRQGLIEPSEKSYVIEDLPQP